MEQKIEFREVRGAGEILNVTFQFIKENYRSFFKTILFISGPFLLLSMVWTGWAQSNFFMDPVGQVGKFFSGFMALLLLMMFAGIFYFSSIYRYIYAYLENGEGEEVKVSQVWNLTRKDFWLFLKTFIGLFVMSFFMFLIVGIAASMLMAAIGSLATVLGPVAVVVGLVLFYGMIFAAFMPLSLIFNIRIYQKKRFFGAFTYCYELISVGWWKGFLVVLSCLLIQISLSVLLSLPGLIAFFKNLHSVVEYETFTTSPYTSPLMVISNILMMVIMYLLTSINIVAANFLYFSLVEKKEGVGLINKIESLGEDLQNGENEQIV